MGGQRSSPRNVVCIIMHWLVVMSDHNQFCPDIYIPVSLVVGQLICVCTCVHTCVHKFVEVATPSNSRYACASGTCKSHVYVYLHTILADPGLLAGPSSLARLCIYMYVHIHARRAMPSNSISHALFISRKLTATYSFSQDIQSAVHRCWPVQFAQKLAIGRMSLLYMLRYP